MEQAKSEKASESKKSGIKKFKAGDVLFNEKDPAESLYIIQRGQIRLYRPKGRGFIEIGILRSGEVIGEMAYFDEKASRRSCSAAAIVPTEVIEISFKAFGKTMSNLNPWFKTIIQTLAERLRNTNDKLKQLESNSIGYSKGASAGDYIFFHNIDVIRLFSTFYMAFKAHGEQGDDGWQLNYTVLKFYVVDVYNISEIKLEEFKELLINEGFLTLEKDKDAGTTILIMKDIFVLRTIMLFLNDQRLKEDSKKVCFTDNCLELMKSVIGKLTGNSSKEAMVEVAIGEVFKSLEAKGLSVGREEYRELVDADLAEEIFIHNDNKLTGKVDYQKIRRMYPSVKVMNAIKRVNESKSR